MYYTTDWVLSALYVCGFIGALVAAFKYDKWKCEKKGLDYDEILAQRTGYGKDGKKLY